ncbi:MAG: hypothetical protein V4592_18555 [Bacteroidota bacterium]
MASRKKLTRRLLIIIGSIAAIYIVLVIYNVISFGVSFGLFDKDYTTTDLISNFYKRRAEIFEAKRYFASKVPPRTIIEIEFKNDAQIARWGMYPGKDEPDQTVKFLEWNLDVNSGKVAKLLKTTGWTAQTLRTIKQKLDAANCISIQSGEPAKIGFKRSGMGMYFFDVFDRPVPDSLKARYNDSCTYIYANRKLVLEYGGGAVGSQCFPVQGK